MKLKLIAAAAVLAASGVANAAIDIGTDGSGDFIFNIWDANSSYTVDLDVLNTDFTAAVAASGSYSFSLNLSADAVFQQFLSTANVASLQWNVIAVESQGAKTVWSTYNTLPATGIAAGNGRSMVGAIQTWEGDVNGSLASSNSAVFSSSVDAYAGNLGCTNFTFQNFNSCGTVAANSYATGLGIVSQNINASGTTASTLTPVADSGTAVRAFLAPGYNLVITAAVPEPETYAMLLAGLGLMGAIARRRQNKA